MRDRKAVWPLLENDGMSGFVHYIGSSVLRRSGMVFGLIVLTAFLHVAAQAASVANPSDPAPTEQYMRRVWRIQDGLPEDTVQAIAQSQDGYLWVGTTGGLVKFDGSHFRLYDHATTPQLVDNSVFSLLPARDGSLWIGTDGGGVVHFENGRAPAYTAKDGLTNSFVRSLLEDEQGRVWIGTDNGLFRFASGKLRQVDTSSYVSTFAVHSIIEGRDHRIWVGGSALLVFDRDHVSVQQLPGRDSENRVKSMVETEDGTIWVGTVGGLNRLVRGKFKPVRQVKGT